MVAVTGQAVGFGGGGGGFAGATVTVAELPALTTTVDAHDTFRIEVPSGGEYSFQVTHPGFYRTQTATLPVGAAGLEKLGFQVITDELFHLLASLLGLTPDPARCQVATTVSAVGTEPYGGSGLGVPDATVTIEPALPPEAGPIYFRYISPSIITPDPSLTLTTIDGGVLFLNVPAGEYILSAHKEGTTFTSVKLTCRPGLLVNAAPPWGIQQR